MQIQDLSLWIFTRTGTLIINIMHYITPLDFRFAVKCSTWWDSPAHVTAIGFCSAIIYELAICTLLLPFQSSLESGGGIGSSRFLGKKPLQQWVMVEVQQSLRVSTCVEQSKAITEDKWAKNISILPCCDSLDCILAGQRLVIFSVIVHSTKGVTCRASWLHLHTKAVCHYQEQRGIQEQLLSHYRRAGTHGEEVAFRFNTFTLQWHI